jgi:hypothetical protein
MDMGGRREGGNAKLQKYRVEKIERGFRRRKILRENMQRGKNK